jgi:hypothetical protein
MEPKPWKSINNTQKGVEGNTTYFLQQGPRTMIVKMWKFDYSDQPIWRNSRRSCTY